MPRIEAVVYGLPVYSDRAGEAVNVDVPFFKINLNNEAVVNAYKYLAYKFAQYLLLKKGVTVRDYDPLTGRLTVEGSVTPDEVLKEYEGFVKEYLIPKLKDKLTRSELDAILPAFYYRRNEKSGATGLSSVILPVKHVEQYFQALASGKYNVQSQSVKKAEKIKRSVDKEINEKKFNPNDLIIIDAKKENAVFLGDDEIEKAFLSVPESKAIGVRMVEERCIYCDTGDIRLLPATGKLGVGRLRLSTEEKTNFSDKAKLCLRCVLVSLLYTLDTGGDFFFQLSGFNTRFRDEKRYGEGETLTAILTIVNKLASDPKGHKALVYNSLFGDEKISLKIEGLDEEAFEKLALLHAEAGIFPFHDKVSQSLIVSYVNAPSFSESLRILLHILKKHMKQLEKTGGREGDWRLSYISKYISSKLNVEKEDKRVAYAMAKLAESILYMIDKKSKEEEKTGENGRKYDYVKRRFADTLRRAGLSKAIAYAVSAAGISPAVITVLVEGEEKDHVKKVFDRYGFKYSEEERMLKVYRDSVPLAEISIEERYTSGIYEDVYTYLVVLKPEIELGGREESGEVEGSA